MDARPPKPWIRSGFIATLMAVYLSLFAWLNGMGARQSPRPADVIIVLGTRAHADGQPGTSLKGRLDTALTLYRSGRAGLIATTGGRGESGVIESVVSRDYLVARGVPPQAIIGETLSHTTWENFLFIEPELQAQGVTSCLIVTDPFHMERSLAIAHELGLSAYPAPSFKGPGWRPMGMVFYTTREMGAWVKYAAMWAGRAWVRTHDGIVNK